MADYRAQITPEASSKAYYEWTSEEEDNDDEQVQTRSNQFHFSWSDEFHDLLLALSTSLGDNPESSFSKRGHYFAKLRKLELDFVYTATTWGRVIIEELFLPDELKTIQPLHGKGVLGGFKFASRGIFFKFAHEIKHLVNASNASKVSGHELRSCSAIALFALEERSSHFPLLLPPLMCMVDFRGFRLLAVSQLPIDETTLIYGSMDGGKTICNSSPLFNEALKEMGSHFQLQPHLSGADNKTVLISGSDIEGHFDSARNRYYILDLARLFPPEAPPLYSDETDKKEDICVEEGGKDNPVLYKQLRPYFVARKEGTALSSDAFSRFQSSIDAERMNEDVRRETTKLHTIYIQRASVFLCHREHDAGLFPVQFLFSSFFHERGINIRLLGTIIKYIPQDSSWYMNCILEMISRSFKCHIRRRFRSLARLKGTGIRASSETFHEELVHALTLLLIRLENKKEDGMKSLAKSGEIATWRQQRDKFWEDLVTLSNHKFPGAHLNTEHIFHSFNECNHAVFPQLFERVCQILGLTKVKREVFFKPITPDAPLDGEEIPELSPSVKHLNLIHLADAQVLYSRAQVESNQQAIKTLSRAKLSLERVLKESPPISSLFLLEIYGEVSYSLGIRNPTESAAFEGMDEGLRNLMKAEGVFREIASTWYLKKQHTPVSIASSKSLHNGQEVYLSSQSKNPAVLKTQHAKRYANVVSSCIVQHLVNPRHLCTSKGILLVWGTQETRSWKLSSKTSGWTKRTVIASTIGANQESTVFACGNSLYSLHGKTGESIRVYDFPDFEIVAVTCWRHQFFIALASGELVRLKGKTKRIEAKCMFLTPVLHLVSCHSDNWFQLAASFPEGKILLLNAELVTLHVLLTDGGISCLVLADDGSRMVCGAIRDHSIRFWNLNSPSRLEDLSPVEQTMLFPQRRLKGHLGNVTCVCFASLMWPNQDTLFSGSVDRTIRIWNLSLLVCLRVLSGHVDSILALHYVEDKKMLFSSSMDSTVRSWTFDPTPFLTMHSESNANNNSYTVSKRKIEEVPNKRRSFLCLSASCMHV